MPRKRKSLASSENSHIEEKLLENLVALQKVNIDMSEKFDKLAKEISSLLVLFELAAKNFSKHSTGKITEADKEFLDKIDKLLEQNKTIAKGLTLMEEQMRKRLYPEIEQQQEVQAVQQIRPVQQTQQVQEIQQVPPSAPPNPLVPSSEYSPSIKSNRPLPRF